MQTNDVDAVVHEERNPSQNIAFFLTNTKDRHETKSEIEIETETKTASNNRSRNKVSPLKKRGQRNERRVESKQAHQTKSLSIKKRRIQCNAMQCNAKDFNAQLHARAQYQVGGVAQCLSIVSIAALHSSSKHVASCCTIFSLGPLPPHISGFRASASEKILTSPSSRIRVRHSHARFQLRLLSGSERTRRCASATMSALRG